MGLRKVRYALALDDVSFPKAVDLATALQGGIRYVKIHMLADEYSYAYARFKELGHMVLCDAKLDDIPRTVEGRVRAMRRSGLIDAVTVHARNLDVLKAAVADGLPIFGVTVLTSEDRAAYPAQNRGVTVEEHVRERMGNILQARAYGSVCSGLDVGIVSGMDQTNTVTRLVPATRLRGLNLNGQRMVTTHGEAVKNGGDILVLGSEMRNAIDPLALFARIEEQVAEALRA